MNILVLNSGSSGLKYKLFRMPEEETLTAGNRESAGDDILGTVQSVIERCRPLGIDAIGHRVVHGGPDFFEPTRITPDVLTTLHSLRDLDPVHNPIEVAVIEEGIRLLPETAAVTVFDTAFHRALPGVASHYALPWELSERLHLRRFGFHGISYRYVSETLLDLLEIAAEGTRMIVCHLGSGASVCAIHDGKSIDTSMGLTPLEGLIMGTRSGDVDPGLLLHLLRTRAMTVSQLDDLLHQQSGLKGLSGLTGDVRQIEEAAAKGDTRAAFALEAFAYRVRKYIGAYIAAMNGTDVIVFTGGIGERSAPMRKRICQEMTFLGIRLDDTRNESATGTTSALLSSDDSPVRVHLIPTDEERQIARETQMLLANEHLPQRKQIEQ